MRFWVITVRCYDAYLNAMTASHTTFLAVSWGLLLQNPGFFLPPSQKTQQLTDERGQANLVTPQHIAVISSFISLQNISGR